MRRGRVNTSARRNMLRWTLLAAGCGLGRADGLSWHAPCAAGPDQKAHNSGRYRNRARAGEEETVIGVAY